MTVLAALAAAGSAAGGDPAPVPFSASFETSGKIAFQLVEKDGDKKLRRIRIRAIAADCEGRSAELEYRIYGSAPVLKDRTFAVRADDETGGEAVVRGTFSRRFTRATGTARLHGKFQLQDGWSTCETGTQEFVAAIAG